MKAFAVAASAAVAAALNNGVGLTPPMGFSSWLAFSSNVTSAGMRNITAIIQQRGLGAKGYHYLNVDEGWLKTRDGNGNIVEDTVKFPEGMKAFGQWVHSQEVSPGSGVYFKYGLYTCRGTCQCGEWDYQGPGSQGHEEQDTQWIVGAGADYLKVDSCCGSQDHGVAFDQYALFRDALNATGHPVHFSLCGWNPWYAPPDTTLPNPYLGGMTLGNQWRIQGDGDTWPALSTCFNTAARLRQYSGRVPEFCAGQEVCYPGWNDPDLIAGPNVHADGAYITDQQARTQFSLWSTIAAPLIITNNLMEASEYYFETIGNAEVIAVNQDPLGIPGYRIVGTDLNYPCNGDNLPPGALYGLEALPCDPTGANPMQQWKWAGNGSAIALAGNANAVADVYDCDSDDGAPVVVYPPDNGGGTCAGNNQKWSWNPANGNLINANSGDCLEAYQGQGPVIDTWQCGGRPGQSWTLAANGQFQNGAKAPNGQPLCLTASNIDPTLGCTNVWGRPLVDGSWAVTMVNNGANNATVTCDAQCIAFMNMTAGPNKQLAVRDLWAHQVVGTLNGDPSTWAWTANVPGDGQSNMYRFIPQ